MYLFKTLIKNVKFLVTGTYQKLNVNRTLHVFINIDQIKQHCIKNYKILLQLKLKHIVCIYR